MKPFVTAKQSMKSPALAGLKDFILDEAITPVARMRLFSDGVNPNTRILRYDTVIGDRACLACGNCVDACPVVKEKQRFVFIQNQRTSMALENIVGDECRRCYGCIQACPQVSKANKDYVASFRRGEKAVHILLAATIVLLAVTGIFTSHFGEGLNSFETAVLKFFHQVFGIVLILLPFLYYAVDRHHLIRLLRRIFVWGESDRKWLDDLIRHMKESRKYALPYTGEFNPGQKAWYLYVAFMIPMMAATGLLLMLVFDDTAGTGYLSVKFIHMFFALATDLLLFVHVYLKYLRKWAISIKDTVKVFYAKRHLNYAELYRRT